MVHGAEPTSEAGPLRRTDRKSLAQVEGETRMRWMIIIAGAVIAEARICLPVRDSVNDFKPVANQDVLPI